MGVSVLDKLHDSWGDNPDRVNREVAALARSAGRFVAFDETEQNKFFEGRSVTPRAVETFAPVILPTPPEQKAFVDTLKRRSKLRSGGQVDFIATADRPSDITLVSRSISSPCASCAWSAVLKQAYEQRLREVGSPRGVLEVHAEGVSVCCPSCSFPDMAPIPTD